MADSGSESAFRNIIAAVDGSEYSNRAAKRAAQLAKRFNSKLMYETVMTIPEYVVFGGNLPGPVVDKIYTVSTDRARQIVTDAVELEKNEGVDADSQVLSNVRSVVQAIVEYSERVNADLIVAGTRGMSGFKKLLLGSVSSGLASHAPCSVLIVR